MSETKKEKAKSFLEKNIPIPPHYAQVDDDDALIASKSVILPFTLALQILQIVALVFFIIYSLPMSNIVTTRIEPDWDYRKDEGWNCTLLSSTTCTTLGSTTTRVVNSTPSRARPPSSRKNTLAVLSTGATTRS